MKNLKAVFSIIIIFSFYLSHGQVKINSELMGIEIYNISKVKLGGKEYINDKPTFALRTSLVDPYSNLPNNGYISDGIQKENWVKPKSKNSGILYFTKKNKFHFVIEYKYRNLLPISNTQWAIQGEILLEEGNNPNKIFGKKKFRTALACNSTKMLVLNSRKPISLRGFGKLIKKYGFYNAIQINEKAPRKKLKDMKYDDKLVYISF